MECNVNKYIRYAGTHGSGECIKERSLLVGGSMYVCHSTYKRHGVCIYTYVCLCVCTHVRICYSSTILADYEIAIRMKKKRAKE